MDSAFPRDDVDAVLNLLIKNFRKKPTSNVLFRWLCSTICLAASQRVGIPCMFMQPNNTKDTRRIEMENYFSRSRLSGCGQHAQTRTSPRYNDITPPLVPAAQTSKTNPQPVVAGKPPIPVLHVAGTKGKGSTCAFAESILRASGLKTGWYWLSAQTSGRAWRHVGSGAGVGWPDERPVFVLS